jgi:hypothetical protein
LFVSMVAGGWQNGWRYVALKSQKCGFFDFLRADSREISLILTSGRTNLSPLVCSGFFICTYRDTDGSN